MASASWLEERAPAPASPPKPEPQILDNAADIYSSPSAPEVVAEWTPEPSDAVPSWREALQQAVAEMPSNDLQGPPPAPELPIVRTPPKGRQHTPRNPEGMLAVLEKFKEIQARSQPKARQDARVTTFVKVIVVISVIYAGFLAFVINGGLAHKPRHSDENPTVSQAERPPQGPPSVVLRLQLDRADGPLLPDNDVVPQTKSVAQTVQLTQARSMSLWRQLPTGTLELVSFASDLDMEQPLTIRPTDTKGAPLPLEASEGPGTYTVVAIASQDALNVNLMRGQVTRYLFKKGDVKSTDESSTDPEVNPRYYVYGRVAITSSRVVMK